jgi:hypothetical protein
VTMATATPQAPESAPQWWRQPFRMFQTNLREIDAGLDVEQVLDFIVEYGANAWLISVGGILSNYPTALPFQTANPYLVKRASGDLIGDAVAAAAKRGVHVLARMDFSKIDHRRAEEHPEWCFVDAAGEFQVYNGLTSVCPSADYYQHRLFDVVDEVLDRYPIDGFFFNWMSYNEIDYSKQYRGVCQCTSCQRAFRDLAPDARLPVGPESPDYATWRQFTATMLNDLTARVRAHVAARRPEAPLILGDRADIVFHEANNAVGRPLWHHRTSEHVSAAKSFRPDVPVLVNSVGFVDMPYRLAGEEPYHFAQYLIQAISRGAIPSTYIMGTPEVIDYECLDIGSEIIRFHRDHADVYRDLVPDAPVALVRPDPLRRPANRLAEVTAEFQGLYLSLLERHIPFDVLPEDKIAPRAAGPHGLDQYAVLVLPDLDRLSAEAVETIDRFVDRGGALVATGASGFEDDQTQLRALPAMRRLASRDNVEAVRSLHLAASIGDRLLPVPVIGAFHVVETRPGAELELMAISRAPYGPPEKCHGHVPLDHPGLVLDHSSTGKVALLPWTVGRAFREVGLSAHRDLFADALLRVAPDVAVRSGLGGGPALHEHVELVRGRSAAGQVIHLLNRSGDADQRFRAPVPIAPATLSLETADCRVRALLAGVDLPVASAEGQPYVQLPEIGHFEVLVVERTAAAPIAGERSVDA